MTDQPTSDAPSTAVCPWCSASLSDPSAPTCPSCGAALVGSVDDSLPGLTTIDAGAIVRAKQTALRPRSRLLSWLSGDDGDEIFTKAEGGALEPPALEVKREMFRLELEAEVANLQAENEAIMAEAVAEGRVLEVPPELADAAGIAVPIATGSDDDEAAEPTEASAAVTVDDAAATPDAAPADEPAQADEPAADATPAGDAEAAPADSAAQADSAAKPRGKKRP